MDWSKAKTILIAFLILTNLVLLYYLVSDSIKSKSADKMVIESVVGILANRNIEVDKKLITDAKYPEKMSAKSCDNCIDDYESFAKKLMKTEVLKTDNLEFSNNVSKIKYSGDYFALSKTGDAPVYSREVSKNNAIAVSKEYLGSVGIDMNNIKSSVNEENSQYVVYLKKYDEDFEIYDVMIEVKLSNAGIESISGVWYNTKETEKTEYTIKSLSQALIEYMNLKNAPAKITNVQLGYATLENSIYHENVVLTPVWRIMSDDGTWINVDAREIK